MTLHDKFGNFSNEELEIMILALKITIDVNEKKNANVVELYDQFIKEKNMRDHMND